MTCDTRNSEILLSRHNGLYSDSKSPEKAHIFTNFFLDNVFLACPTGKTASLKKNFGIRYDDTVAEDQVGLALSVIANDDLLNSNTQNLLQQLSACFENSSDLNYDDHLFKRNAYKKLRKKTLNLRDRQKMILRAGLSGHATKLLIERQSNGNFAITHFNTGLGLNSHHEKKIDPFGQERYQTFTRRENIPEDSISNLSAWKKIFEAKRSKDVKDLYDAVELLSSGGVIDPTQDGKLYLYEPAQREGSCVFMSCMALIRQQVLTQSGNKALNSLEYKKVKALLRKQLFRNTLMQNSPLHGKKNFDFKTLSNKLVLPRINAANRWLDFTTWTDNKNNRLCDASKAYMQALGEGYCSKLDPFSSNSTNNPIDTYKKYSEENNPMEFEANSESDFVTPQVFALNDLCLSLVQKWAAEDLELDQLPSPEDKDFASSGKIYLRGAAAKYTVYKNDSDARRVALPVLMTKSVELNSMIQEQRNTILNLIMDVTDFDSKTAALIEGEETDNVMLRSREVFQTILERIRECNTLMGEENCDDLEELIKGFSKKEALKTSRKIFNQASSESNHHSNFISKNIKKDLENGFVKTPELLVEQFLKSDREKEANQVLDATLEYSRGTHAKNEFFKIKKPSEIAVDIFKKFIDDKPRSYFLHLKVESLIDIGHCSEVAALANHYVTHDEIDKAQKLKSALTDKGAQKEADQVILPA